MNFEEVVRDLSVKVAGICTDVKWIKKDREEANKIIETHIAESNKFRGRVTKNTVWRVAHHFGFVIVFGIIGFIAWRVLK